MNYTYITLILSVILTIVFLLIYKQELGKKKANRIKTDPNTFLYSTGTSFIIVVVTIMYLWR